MACFTML